MAAVLVCLIPWRSTASRGLCLGLHPAELYMHFAACISAIALLTPELSHACFHHSSQHCLDHVWALPC